MAVGRLIAIVVSEETSQGATSNSEKVDSPLCLPSSIASLMRTGSSSFDSGSSSTSPFFLIRERVGSGAGATYESLEDSERRRRLGARSSTSGCSTSELSDTSESSNSGFSVIGGAILFATVYQDEIILWQKKLSLTSGGRLEAWFIRH